MGPDRWRDKPPFAALRGLRSRACRRSAFRPSLPPGPFAFRMGGGRSAAPRATPKGPTRWHWVSRTSASAGNVHKAWPTVTTGRCTASSRRPTCPRARRGVGATGAAPASPVAWAPCASWRLPSSGLMCRPAAGRCSSPSAPHGAAQGMPSCRPRPTPPRTCTATGRSRPRASPWLPLHRRPPARGARPHRGGASSAAQGLLGRVRVRRLSDRPPREARRCSPVRDCRCGVVAGTAQARACAAGCQSASDANSRGARAQPAAQTARFRSCRRARAVRPGSRGPWGPPATGEPPHPLDSWGIAGGRPRHRGRGAPDPPPVSSPGCSVHAW